MLSCVLIIPAALLTKANALAEAMGWGENNYSVALSASGDHHASHYGLHTWVQPSFEQMMLEAQEGVMPDALADALYPAADFAAVVEAATWSIRDDMTDHFQSIAQGLGLHMLARAVSDEVEANV